MAIGHSFQDVLEVGERLDVVEFCGGQQRSDNRPTCRAAVGSGEEVILAAEGNGSDRPLDRVSVEFEAAVIEESAQITPAGEGIPDRVGETAPRRDAFELFLKPDLHRLDQRQRPGSTYAVAGIGRLASYGRLDRIELGNTP